MHATLDLTKYDEVFGGVIMLDRKSIANAMQFALGRSPDEVAYMGCQAAFHDINGLVENLISSEEFKSRSWHAAVAKARARLSERSVWRNEPSDIDWAYKTFLGRAPESYSVIAAWLLNAPTREQVVENFMMSDEFRSNAWHLAAQAVRDKFSTAKPVIRKLASSNA